MKWLEFFHATQHTFFKLLLERGNGGRGKKIPQRMLSVSFEECCRYYESDKFDRNYLFTGFLQVIAYKRIL